MGYRMRTSDQVIGTERGEFQNSFNVQINAIVKERGLNRRQFAEIIGTAQPYASKILLGKTTVSMDYAQRIMDRLGLSYEFNVMPQNDFNDQSLQTNRPFPLSV